MSDSDSDSNLERVLRQEYSFLQHIIATDSPPSRTIRVLSNKTKKKTQRIQPPAKRRKNSNRKGSVGATCTGYGVKHCLCCNVDNGLGSRELNGDTAQAMDGSVAHQSSLRDVPCHTSLTTSTPLKEHAIGDSQEASSSSAGNSLDISAIRVATTVRDAQTDTQNEEHIMDYVNDLLGDTSNSIVAEVEERYQRLDNNRLAVSEAILNAITVEDLDFDDSVILVGESSPQPILIDDSVVDVTEVSEKPPTDETAKKTKVIENKEGKSTHQRTRECPICIEEFTNKDISATTCGHVFCTECIRAAVKVSKLCPICRTKLTQRKIHPLYCLL